MAEIPLHGKHARGRVALVDDADLLLVTGYRWRVMQYTRSDGVEVGPYVIAKIPTGRRGGRTAYIHAVITGYRRTDHENGDGLDNRRVNLRDCSQSQNCANRGKRRTGGSSRFKGVQRLPSGSWQARIKVNRRERYLGCFAAEEDAARAYDAAAASAWGEFALTNRRLGLLTTVPNDD